MTDFSKYLDSLVLVLDDSKSLLRLIYEDHLSEKVLLDYPDCNLGNIPSPPNSLNISPNSEVLRLLGYSNTFPQFTDKDILYKDKFLGKKLKQSLAYIDKIVNRISSPVSKVLITGDVNSGKSTFINAFFGIDLLPTDQQPCTQAFCEIDFEEGSENSQVHAIMDYEKYDPSDESTFYKHDIDTFKTLVQDSSCQYQIFKIFLNKSFCETTQIFTHIPTSSINNMNLVLIDSPGLNSDLFKTFSLYTKQADIDVIVFLINAANHLTLSAREFLEKASQEKSRIFIVVNKFDEIKNHAKCMNSIMTQIMEILPETFAEKHQLIHFISADQFLNADPRIKNLSWNEPFERLKDCLMRFIFCEKIKSKLLPAKTYIEFLLKELVAILGFNLIKNKENIDQLGLEMEILKPTFDLIESRFREFRNKADIFCMEISANILLSSKTRLSSFRNYVTVIESIEWKGSTKLRAFLSKIHTNIISETEAYLKELSNDMNAQVSVCNHKLNGAASYIDSNIFSSFPQKDPSTFVAPSVILQSPRLASALMNIVSTKLSNVFTLGAILGSIVGAKPLFGLLSRFLMLTKFSGRFFRLAMPLIAFVAVGGVLFREMEYLIRSHAIDFYRQQFESPKWTEEPAVFIQKNCVSKIFELKNQLTSHFDEALRVQKQITSEKKMKLAQIRIIESLLAERQGRVNQILAKIQNLSI